MASRRGNKQNSVLPTLGWGWRSKRDVTISKESRCNELTAIIRGRRIAFLRSFQTIPQYKIRIYHRSKSQSGIMFCQSNYYHFSIACIIYDSLLSIARYKSIKGWVFHRFPARNFPAAVLIQ